MVINKKLTKKSAIKASNARVARRRQVRASEDEDEEEIDVESEGVNVDPEASDLLFEAEDVAELLAEVTGKDVAVTAEDDVVTFDIGEDQFTVEAEGGEEILESTRKALKGKAPVRASRTLGRRGSASRKSLGRRR